MVDYSSLNKRLEPVDMSGAPRLETVVHQVGSVGGQVYKLREADPQCLVNKWLCSTTDLHCGFNQVTVAERGRELTAFSVPGVQGEHSKLHYVKSPFGTKSMPCWFNRMTGSVIGDMHFGHLDVGVGFQMSEEYKAAKLAQQDKLAHADAAALIKGCEKETPEKCATHYIDDLFCVTMSSWKRHIIALRHMFHRMALHGLGCRIDKTLFAQDELCVLGWQISEGKVRADMEKVHKMIDGIGGPECRLKDKSDV